MAAQQEPQQQNAVGFPRPPHFYKLYGPPPLASAAAAANGSQPSAARAAAGLQDTAALQDQGGGAQPLRPPPPAPLPPGESFPLFGQPFQLVRGWCWC